MKKKILFIFVLSAILISCKEDKDPFGGVVPKYTYSFEDRNSEIKVSENDGYFNLYLKQDGYNGPYSTDVFVDVTKSSAKEGVHYNMPDELKFVFSDQAELKSTVKIELIPQNITKIETLTFYITKISNKDQKYIDTTTVTIIPIKQ